MKVALLCMSGALLLGIAIGSAGQADAPDSPEPEVVTVTEQATITKEVEVIVKVREPTPECTALEAAANSYLATAKQLSIVEGRISNVLTAAKHAMYDNDMAGMSYAESDIHDIEVELIAPFSAAGIYAVNSEALIQECADSY